MKCILIITATAMILCQFQAEGSPPPSITNLTLSAGYQPSPTNVSELAKSVADQPLVKLDQPPSNVEAYTVIKTNRPSIRELTDEYDWGLDKWKLSNCEVRSPQAGSSCAIDQWYWQLLGEFAKVAISH